MKKMRILILLLVASTSHVLGCSCENWPTVKKSIKSANIVFSGQVISNTVTKDFGDQIIWEGDSTTFPVRLLRYPARVIKLKVLTLYNGNISSDTVTVITPFNGAGCGVDFQIGKDYI